MLAFQPISRALYRLIAAALLVVAAGAVESQQQLPPPVLTLDQERLFQFSRAAGQISDEIEREATALAAENREIEAALTVEENELTEARPTLEPDAFRALADAFDEKVQRIRAEQDAKERALQARREAERQSFLRRITPILAEITRERGALVVLDRRAVLLSADTIDITDLAIARIDAEFAPEPNETPDPEDDDAASPDPEAETD